MTPPSPLQILTFILTLLIFSTPTNSQDLEPQCTDRWIYIRQLPSIYNLDLLTNCSQYQTFENFCPYISNHGLGLKTHNKSHSWFRTDPQMLELIFHRRLLEYPCLTNDHTLASAIFVPYYAGIDALKYLYGQDQNSSFLHGVDLYHHIRHIDRPEIWKRHKGHDHFLIMARPAWDFSQPLLNDPPIWGTSFLELQEFYNVTALTFESRAYPFQEIAIPYPTSFHPPNLALFDSWISRVRRSRRNTLMLFAGGGGISNNPNVRRSIRLECENSTNWRNESDEYSRFCEFVDCSNGICEHDPIKFMKPMLQASFCLQPPGDTPTRRSTFDAILAGCIPVFFEEMSAKAQYVWHLPEDEYEEFSVFIPKEDVVFKGVKILDVLTSIPRARVRRMREKVIEMLPRVIYRKHGSSLGMRAKKDAFDIAIEGTLQRIKSRLQEVEVQ
ncbi:putative xyloglucan galactosyltransferase GT19 [Apium graveolens]|uniref:putative xyloglucan galactosyltransferase GT19 n=1 Tax=Apium graveolens TaxID=4045 RepID=UPI003D79E47E